MKKNITMQSLQKKVYTRKADSLDCYIILGNAYTRALSKEKYLTQMAKPYDLSLADTLEDMKNYVEDFKAGKIQYDDIFVKYCADKIYK